VSAIFFRADRELKQFRSSLLENKFPYCTSLIKPHKSRSEEKQKGINLLSSLFAVRNKDRWTFLRVSYENHVSWKIQLQEDKSRGVSLPSGDYANHWGRVGRNAAAVLQRWTSLSAP